MEPPQNVIKSKLFKHQKEGLGKTLTLLSLIAFDKFVVVV